MMSICCTGNTSPLVSLCQRTVSKSSRKQNTGNYIRNTVGKDFTTKKNKTHDNKEASAVLELFLQQEAARISLNSIKNLGFLFMFVSITNINMKNITISINFLAVKYQNRK